MLKKISKMLRTRFFVWVSLAVIGFTAIILLAVNVVGDLRLLNSARSDNVQWTLSQTEVEFLEFEFKVIDSLNQEAPRLRELRREFDIFYSRISTLRESSLYSELRNKDEFSSNLSLVWAFLQESIPAIDGSNEELISALPTLLDQARVIRSNVRALSNSGLNYFAEESDRRRANVAMTLIQMAGVVTILLFALMFLAIYLNYLNTQNMRRSAEATEAGNRMKIVTSTSLDAVIVSDSDGRVLDFNSAAEQIFGHSAKDAIGSDLGELIVPDHHRLAHNAGMKRMRERGEKRVVGKGRVKLEAKHASGSMFPVELAIQSAKTEKGEIFIAFIRDISHRVKAEKDLVEARDRALAGEKAKTDFLATMSHEIRTPLNGLLGNLSLMRDTKLSVRQTRYIKNMETSGKLLMNHITDVLDITKYDAGKLRLRPVEMNISTLLQDIIDNQSGAASANDTTLQWGWDGIPTDWIRADRDRIQHILMNVIGNAIKFTHGGSILVKAKSERAHLDTPELIVTVSDTGSGIDEKIKSHIFDDFVTGDSSYGRNVGGTGLGLGIALRFVKALGGSISVTSEIEKGSEFVIRFPIDPIIAPAEAKDRKSAPVTNQSKRILLVEDNAINRDVAREMLATVGHHVTEAHNGQMAVELASIQEFDLILMDISMPVMDGREATRHIRAAEGTSAHVPIIAFTANAMPDEQEAYLADGMNDVLTKPLNRDALLKIVSSQFTYSSDSTEKAEIKHTPVSLSHIDELRDTLGVETLQSLLDRFVTEVEQTLESLQDIDKIGLEETGARAHKIAGSAATMGAVDLSKALIQVEDAVKVKDWSATRDAVEALADVWKVTRHALKADRLNAARSS